MVRSTHDFVVLTMVIVSLSWSTTSAFGRCAWKRSTTSTVLVDGRTSLCTNRSSSSCRNTVSMFRCGKRRQQQQRLNAMSNVPHNDLEDADHEEDTVIHVDYDRNLPNHRNTFQLVEGMGWQSYFAEQWMDEDKKQNLKPVRVTEVRSNGLHVVGQDMDEMIPPSSLGKRHRVVVGDWILLDAAQNRIRRVLDRKSLLQRRAPGSSGGMVQLIVANLDTVFLVSSCNQDFNVARLERYVAMALEANVTPVIVLTKRDIYDDYDDSDEATAVLNSYRDDAQEIAGVPVVVLDARGDEPTHKLAKWCLPGHTVAFLGSSGVGKSTLANSLCGQRVAETAAIHEDSGQGRHTTTRRQLYFLANGCAIVDTPGLRELQLFDVSQGLTEVFSDLVELSLQCRFNDCQHAGEPGCAIEEAVENGEIDGHRVTRWQKLVSEDQVNSKTVAEGKVKALQKTMRQKQAKKKKRYQE